MLLTELQQVSIETTLAFKPWLFPSQIVVFRRLCSSVTKTLGVISGYDEVRRGKEGLDKLILLVADILPDAFRNRDDAPLEFHYAYRDPVHVEHNIRALGTVATYRHFLGNGEVIVL